MKRELAFGYGKVLITPTVFKKTGKGELILQENKGTGTIGEYTNGKDFRYSNNDFVLSFKNVQSLDVIIERLNVLKKMMVGQEVTIPYQGEEIEE